MDDKSQEDLWFLLIDEDEILYCDKCVAEHNAKVASTGKAQEITVPYAPNGLVEFMVKKYGADPAFLRDVGQWNGT
jgi:hypothetical protein